MVDFARSRDEGLLDAASDAVTSPVLGEGLSELRTAGDRAEELGHAAPFFGSDGAGATMAELGQSAPVKLAGDLLAPLSFAAGARELSKGIGEGDWGAALHGGTGAFVSGVGTAGAIGDAASWLGTTLQGSSAGASLSGFGESLAANVGLKSCLGPTAAVIGSGLAGWDIGNEFNAITRASGMYGSDSDGKRSFSDAAGDDGWAAHEAVAHALGGEAYGPVADAVGHLAGGATVLGESALGTIEAAPTVLGHEAAGLGRAIDHGASRLFDWLCDD